jgi:hypothetical protein
MDKMIEKLHERAKKTLSSERNWQGGLCRGPSR